MHVIITDSPITISYTEKHAVSPIDQLNNSDWVATRVLLCAWDDSATLATQLLGRTYVSDDDLYFEVGHRYPYSANGDHMIADEISIEPVPGVSAAGVVGSELIKYDEAQLTVTYRVQPKDDLQILVSETMEPFSEFLTISAQNKAARTLYWDNAQALPMDITELPGMLIRGMEWKYTIHRLPQLPTGWDTLIGKVNTSELTVAETGTRFNKAFAAETLLYTPPEIVEYVDFEGNPLWDVTFCLIYRPDGWNKLPKVDSTGHKITMSVIYDNSGNAFDIYSPLNFESIFLVKV